MLRNSKGFSLLIFVFLLLLVNVFLLHLDWRSSHRGLTFAMLDVGQGDGIFIESPTGTQIIFDGGPARKILGPLARVLSPFDKNIDAIVITNPDADHIGGFLDILKNYQVGGVFEPGTLNSSKIFQNLKEEMNRQNVPNILARRGMRLDIGGGAFIDILFPDRDVSTWETNDGSVVARLSYGDMSIMLTGDSTTKTEKIILGENYPKQLRSSILKVGHHGSRSSTSPEFLKAISPEYAFISVGKNSQYGHPHPEILSRLSDFGVKIFRTDELGSVIIKCATIKKCEIN
jgi:competence protein ComEC